MAKQPRTTMSGKEARYILKQNSVNLAWLAEQLEISPQALNSRLNADTFTRANQMEINSILKKDVFGIGEQPTEVMAARAAYCAGRMGLDAASVRVYGPHGQGLVVASAPGEGYSA